MTFEELCKQIINEAETDKTNNQSNETTNVITSETNTNTEEPVKNEEITSDKSTEKETAKITNELNLSDIEVEFLQKFIEYTELKYLDSKYQDIMTDFSKVLGNDIKTNVLQFLNEHKQKQIDKLNELKKELNELRNNIKETEEEKTKDANRKLNLISILDKNVVNESADVESNSRVVDLNLPDTKINQDIIRSVFGQISDGIWENSTRMEGYWYFEKELIAQDGKLFLIVDTQLYPTDKYLQSKHILNPYVNMSDDAIINFIANKIKQIALIEFEDTGKFEKRLWKRNNQTSLCYLSRDTEITVSDAYKAYDLLKGRVRPASDYIKTDTDTTTTNTPTTVKVTCYHKTREYKSAEEAIAYFKEGMSYCDPGSSEYSRYASIVEQLEAGDTEVSDEY